MPDSPTGRLIQPEQRIPPADARRQILQAICRLLVQKREPKPTTITRVLRQTIHKLRDTVGARAAALLVLDPSVKSADVIGVALPKGLKGASALEDSLAGSAIPFAELGCLRELPQPLCQDSFSEDEQPRAFDVACGTPTQTLAAVPLPVSDRLNAVLVVFDHLVEPHDYSLAELALLDDCLRHLVLAVQRSLGLGSALDEEAKGRCVALLAGCNFWSPPPQFEPNAGLIRPLGWQVLLRYGILPLASQSGGRLLAALGNPLDRQSVEDFELATGRTIGERLAATEAEVRRQLRRVFPDMPLEEASEDGSALRGDLVAQIASTLEDLSDATPLMDFPPEEVDEKSSPIVRLASRLIEDAYFRGASDIHVEIGEREVLIRHRIDGTCRPRTTLPSAVARPLVARLKIMSLLDISERRLPQDGRIDFRRYNPELPIDLRVSVLPMLHGEWICMRILEKRRSALPLEKLGFSDHNLERYRRAITTPYGLILHCGPTGAGKSMTLYAALREISGPEVKVVTAEDPIEYVMPLIGQLQIKESIGLDFARALRSFLRHDPDVILVGEIRDEETAKIAVDASLTGHLLLSTLHTNDAASSIARLVRLGIEPFLVANTLVALCAQRLVRRLCHCARRDDPSPGEARYLERAFGPQEGTRISRAVGCEQCKGLGYRGRMGIHELMLMNSKLRHQISQEATAAEIEVSARAAGMRTLFEDSLEKVLAGRTTMEETLRVCQPDEV